MNHNSNKANSSDSRCLSTNSDYRKPGDRDEQAYQKNQRFNNDYKSKSQSYAHYNQSFCGENKFQSSGCNNQVELVRGEKKYQHSSGKLQYREGSGKNFRSYDNSCSFRGSQKYGSRNQVFTKTLNSIKNFFLTKKFVLSTFFFYLCDKFSLIFLLVFLLDA